MEPLRLIDNEEATSIRNKKTNFETLRVGMSFSFAVTRRATRRPGDTDAWALPKYCGFFGCAHHAYLRNEQLRHAWNIQLRSV